MGIVARVLRAALLAYLDGLKPKDRIAFVGRFLHHLGFGRVRSIRDPKPDAEAFSWLTEHIGDMLDHG